MPKENLEPVWPFSIASTTTVTNLSSQLHNGKVAPGGNIVGDTDSQTLTAKTLTSPTITTPVINGASTGTGVAGTDSTLLSAGSMTGATGVPVCKSANGGATTSGCAAGGGFKVECTSVTPVTVANTTTKSPLIASCTLAANEINPQQWFYFEAYGTIGDTAAPSFTIELDLDGTIIGSYTPTLAAANNQTWALKGWFFGITTGSSGTTTGAGIQWMSSPSGGGGSSGAVNANFGGVGSPPLTVTVNTTVSHVLQLQVTWGAANSLNTITQQELLVYRVN